MFGNVAAVGTGSLRFAVFSLQSHLLVQILDLSSGELENLAALDCSIVALGIRASDEDVTFFNVCVDDGRYARRTN